MGVTLSAWLQTLQALLPPGIAITREPGARFTSLLEAIAAMLLAAQVRLEALTVQWDPRRATSMLADWERLLGLPDDCAPAGQLLLDRQVAAFGRLTEVGGQSRAYFIDMATRNGEPGCTIDEFRPVHCNNHCNDALVTDADVFTWRVNIPRAALNVRIANCNNDCNSALRMYTPSAIECLFGERKPAHTTVVFSYAP